MINRDNYDRAADYIYAVTRHRKNMIRLTITVIVLCIAAVLGFLYEYYKITSITVEGSTRYTNSEIAEMVTDGFLQNNSMVLSLEYKNKTISNVPFVEKMDVTVLSHNSIKITVYEKSIAGYVDYLGTNFYFSRDGTVVEASNEKLEGIPMVKGLSFSNIVLYEKLPVENDEIFGRILNVTQLLQKYKLEADSMYFDKSGNLSLYFGEVRVSMGNENYTDEKLSNVVKILPSLEGKGAGTLELDNFTPETGYIIFVLKDGKARDVLGN